MQLTSTDHGLIDARARDIGRILERNFPTVTHDGANAIPYHAIQPVAHEITLVVANILQAWLDAGSERDVTLEELYSPIEDHVRDWAATDRT